MPAPARRRRWWVGAASVVGAAGVIAAAIALGLRGSSPDAPATSSGSASDAARIASGGPPTDLRAGSDAGPAAGGDASGAAQLVASASTEAASGNFAKARALLVRAYALDPIPATLLALGRIDYQTGRCRDARRAAQRVVEVVPGGALAEQARDLLARIGRCD